MRISIIIPTRNSSKDLRYCLKSLEKQTYPNFETIISDGLSSDDTLRVANDYDTKIVINNKILAEPGVREGFKAATGDILVVLAVDNIFKEKNALSVIAKVFEEESIFAAFPKQDSTKKDNLLTRYINTFTDPFNHFVYGYAANARTFNKVFKTVESNKIYDIYDYKSSNIKPLLALAQGFSVRKSFILEKNNEMDDISPILTLIEEGKLVAYIHSIHLYHHTIRSLSNFIKKQRWAANNAIRERNYGISSRINFFSRFQKIKVYLFPIYSLTFLFPILFALFHLFRDREKMWLFHPLISFISGISISYEYVKIKLGFKDTILR